MSARVLSLVVLDVALAGCAAGATPAAPAAEPTPQTAPAVAPGELPAMGGQAEGARAPADEDAAEITTLEEAESALAQAQSVLEGLKLADQSGVGRDSAKKDSAPARRRSAAAPAAPAEAEEKADDVTARCETACRAFASLERAASAVCRLAGDADERCARARRLVGDNAQRVAACGCPK